MKIRFLTSVAGANFAYRVKREYDLRADLAQAFIKSGQAVAVEAATMAAPEQATHARQKRRAAFKGGGLALE